LLEISSENSEHGSLDRLFHDVIVWLGVKLVFNGSQQLVYLG